uniref:TRAP dicarboxylate transporter, DctQ subunit n=1 Tax=uncultured bacterium ws406H10 TaxID=1131831 RepID=I1X5F7_9BACT|nr:TRAP dicarboxylate transporter, DctQ subunit [uncultured bacterium ws406H10]
MSFARLTLGFERFSAALAAVAAVLTLAMSLWISYDVIARNLFGIGSPWFFDLSEYALVWITFLAAPWVLMQDRHVRIEIIVDVLPVRLQRLLGIAVSLVAIIACAVLAWRTGIAAYEYYDRNVMMPRIWRIPRILPYFIIPLGSTMLTLAFCIRLVRYLSLTDPESAFRAAASAGQESGQSDGEGS